MKIDKTVKKETAFLFVGTLILCGVMTGIFALSHRLDYTVITGALLGGLASVLNFFLMALSVQSAVNTDKDTAKRKMQSSYTLRSFALLAVLGVGVYLPYFHWLAVLLSALFPRVTIFFRSFMLKKEAKAERSEADERD